MSRENGKQKIGIPAVITLVLSAFLAAGVMLLFHACGPAEDGSWMSCHYAQLTVFGLALGMTVCSFAAMFLSWKKSAAFYVITIALAIAAAVIPGNVIHLCMMSEMRCRAVMRPAVILVSVLIIVFSAVSIAAGKNGRRTGRT